jgi:phosphoribosylaminoimidazole (AIR) synthetase
MRWLPPHIDANAYTHVKNIKHLTILAAVDGMNATNGGLDAAITAERNIHAVAAVHHFQTSIGSIHSIDRRKDCQMLDVFNMGVGRSME